jgi:hypothetical protein
VTMHEGVVSETTAQFGGDVERKLVKKFNKSNDLYFECSDPNCSWTFQFAVRNSGEHQLPQEEKATFEAQRDESFKNHVCSKHKQRQ